MSDHPAVAVHEMVYAKIDVTGSQNRSMDRTRAAGPHILMAAAQVAGRRERRHWEDPSAGTGFTAYPVELRILSILLIGTGSCRLLWSEHDIFWDS